VNVSKQSTYARSSAAKRLGGGQIPHGQIQMLSGGAIRYHILLLTKISETSASGYGNSNVVGGECRKCQYQPTWSVVLMPSAIE